MTVTPEFLNELAQRCGLGSAYYDHRGQLHQFSSDARIAILKAMGLPMENESAVNEALRSRSSIAEYRFKDSIPDTCFQPACLATQKRWGLSIQLYTLRSNRNWGIGDFDDLRDLIDLAAPLGCDVIGLNPLHALFPAEPQQFSPYSPSSRYFLNILYIAVPSIPEFASCLPVQALMKESSMQGALNAVRRTDNVMYEQVTTLKLCALRLLHEHFHEAHVAKNTPRGRAFADFVEEHGERLRLHAIFDALHMHLRDSVQGSWQSWPAQFQDPHSAAVKAFGEEYAHEVDFFLYVQWIADQQLADVQHHAIECGLCIGLYGDIAVGANPGGSEVWSNQSLYVRKASVGAPPDPLALNGQDWGIPPIDPFALRQQSFNPLTHLLRDNMRHVGAVRIDHVMALFRLWWVPHGFSAVDGVYVHYPLDTIVKIIAVESERAKCLVIGEDLGTVPDEMRHAMAQYRLFHYNVLFFEKFGDRFKAPHEYVECGVATATTHDLPPLKAWWQGDDIELRERLGLYPTADTAGQLRHERDTDRRGLLTALHAANLWHWQPHDPIPEFTIALARALHLYLGISNAALVLVQLEDLIGMTDPVNVPGTFNEHANWQRKLTIDANELFARKEVQEMLNAVQKSRKGENPNG